MSALNMWSSDATMLLIMIIANLGLSLIGDLPWLIVGILLLLAGLFACYKQGMNLGHAACSVSSTVENARNAGEAVFAQLDRKYLAKSFCKQTGIKGLLLSALIPYVLGCVYIIMSMFMPADPAPVPLIIARLLAWLSALPYWPIIMKFHTDFVTLTPDIVAMLMITPFLMPAATYLGYLRGPKLWEHTENAMKEGRRRAKARARVGKTLAPKQQKPEI